MKTPQLIIDFLNPGFLKRLDRYLLLNSPRLWISKIHYVFYYGLWANIILNFLVFIFFSESSQSHLIDEFIRLIILIVMLIELAAFVYWFLKQCLFNIEKEYGNYSFTDGIIEIIIYIMCTVIIISSSLTMTVTAIHRVANTSPVISEKTNCNDSAWDSKFCFDVDGYGYCYQKEICTDIQEFITNDIDEFSSILPYEIYWIIQTMFAVLAIFFLIIKKHSNWRIIGYIILYIIILTILGIFLGTFLISADINFFAFIDTIFFHIDLSNSGLQILVGLTFLIILFMIFMSIQLAKKRKYPQFLYINFLSLPIAVVFLICFFCANPSYTNKEIVWILIKFFLVYSCLVPLQKKVLNHISSLPKE